MWQSPFHTDTHKDPPMLCGCLCHLQLCLVTLGSVTWPHLMCAVRFRVGCLEPGSEVENCIQMVCWSMPLGGTWWGWPAGSYPPTPQAQMILWKVLALGWPFWNVPTRDQQTAPSYPCICQSLLIGCPVAVGSLFLGRAVPFKDASGSL